MSKHTMNETPNMNDSKARKRKAIENMKQMRKESPYPKDYDFEAERNEAMKEKYGCFM